MARSGDVVQVAKLISDRKDDLLRDWRAKVKVLPSAQGLDIPTLNDHVPQLIDQLVFALLQRSDGVVEETMRDGAPPIHGLQRVQDGYDIDEVVSEYNILRSCIHGLADAEGLSLQGDPFHVLNLVFDQAIGFAVQTFATTKALEVQKRREDYLAFVAHDLRTPLNAIALAARVLEKNLSSDGRAEDKLLLRTLNRNVQHLATMVADILKENANLATESGVRLELRSFDLWPLVEILIHDIAPVAGTASTELVNEVPVDLEIYADASLVRRIFQNLIANAIKYTPRGKVIIRAFFEEDRDWIKCCVQDDGMGIPEARISSIFEKYESNDCGNEGFGLGLAIVKTFVEAHGGRVGAESVEGEGSNFWFTLPCKNRIAGQSSC